MTIINPYSTLSPKLKTALDAIIANLPLSPTFENLNDALFNAMFPTNPPSDDMTIVYVKSILPNVYNSFVTSSVVEKLELIDNVPRFAAAAQYNHYSDKQYQIIQLLLKTISTTPTESIPQLLSATDEKIANSGLSIIEQTPLFVATSLGKATCEYWLQNIPQPSAWAAYMVNPTITPQAMDALNYAHVNSWVSAAMQGVLSGWGSVHLPKIDFVDMTAAFVGATGMAAGKVVFKW
jgi:hypothetical protein